jgi:hypothetical protein
MAALLNEGAADRFPTEAAISGFSGTAASFAAASGADLTSPAGVSAAAFVEGFAVRGAAGCDASSEIALGEFADPSLVSADLPESAWSSALCAGARGAGCPALLGAVLGEKFFRCGSHGSKF